MTPTDTPPPPLCRRLSRKNVNLPCFSTSTSVTVHFRGSACGKSHRLQTAYTNAPASGPVPGLRFHTSDGTPPCGEGMHNIICTGPSCVSRRRPLGAPTDALAVPVPSTTTIISNLAWHSCNDVMLGRANWVVDGSMAGCRRELLEILEIDWEARPRCGTQSSKEDRRRENRQSRLVGAPN